MTGGNPNDYWLTTNILGTRPRVSPEQVRAARLTVAAYAHSPDDCRQLLEALGLDDREETT